MFVTCVDVWIHFWKEYHTGAEIDVWTFNVLDVSIMNNLVNHGIEIKK